MMFVYILNIVI